MFVNLLARWLFGLRRIGKTPLLKEFVRRTLAEDKSVVPVYMDLSYLSSSPENFSLGYVGQVCYWLLTRGESDPEPFLGQGTLPTAVLQAGASDLHDALKPLLRELEKARPDRQALLRQAFRFPRQAATARQCKLALIFDEFQEICTLANFSNSRNAIARQDAPHGRAHVVAGQTGNGIGIPTVQGPRPQTVPGGV